MMCSKTSSQKRRTNTPTKDRRRRRQSTNKSVLYTPQQPTTMLSSRSGGAFVGAFVQPISNTHRRKGGKRITATTGRDFGAEEDIIPNNDDDDENEEGKKKDLAALERDLELQISLENYARAARLRDEIKALKENDLVGVETCNATFYDAFRRGDWTTMDSKVWGRGDHVRCTHPGMPTVVGEENVRESWKIVFESMEGRNGGSRNTSREQQMDVQCKSVEAYANGNLGIVTCEEVVMRASTLTCTNVFEKQEGEWKMIQHHASAVFPGSAGTGGNNTSSESSSE